MTMMPNDMMSVPATGRSVRPSWHLRDAVIVSIVFAVQGLFTVALFLLPG